MFGTLIGFWRAHKCRASIVAVLRPHVAQWRRDGGTDAELETPVAIGFLATLIAALARREAGRIDSDALGSLQAEVWRTLTGLPAANLGERIVALSVANDAGFARGCRAALLFEAAQVSLGAAGPDGLGPTAGAGGPLAVPSAAGTDSDLKVLWRRGLVGDCLDSPSGIS